MEANFEAVYGPVGPLKPYQTRVVRLYGNRGIPESPIVCDLLVVYMIHAKFEGFVVQISSLRPEYLTSYEALSYTWGDSTATRTISCNGKDLHVTDTLFEALHALRTSGSGTRYLWVDAICINQADHEEKSLQIPNMLQIYQNARRVVVWLGPSYKHLDVLLCLAQTFHKHTKFKGGQTDLGIVITALQDLYSRPWFQRLWVQQEVFASRELGMQCGNHEFVWYELFSSPRLLQTLPQLKPFDNDEEGGQAPLQAKSTLESIQNLQLYHDRQLKSFEEFRIAEGMSTGSHDFYKTLVSTKHLNATDSRDHVYAILGLTGYASEPASFSRWVQTRHLRSFVPIDYDIDFRSLLCVVTWNMVFFEKGLPALIKYKFISTSPNGQPRDDLPSWVIDWQLVPAGRRLWPFSPPHDYRQRLKRWRLRQLAAGVPYHKLSVRGAIEPALFSQGKHVFARHENQSYKFWTLDFDTQPGDIVASLNPLYYEGEDDGPEAGWWLLRPRNHEEFQIIAFLPHFTMSKWAGPRPYFEEMSYIRSKDMESLHSLAAKIYYVDVMKSPIIAIDSQLLSGSPRSARSRYKNPELARTFIII